MKIAIVSSMNIKRGIQLHRYLSNQNYFIRSFGIEDLISIPYKEGTVGSLYFYGSSYKYIADDLRKKDNAFYLESGLLECLELCSRIKEAPEHFFMSRDHTFIDVGKDIQELQNEGGVKRDETFDIIICCDFDNYKKVFTSRHSEMGAIVLGFNMCGTAEMCDAEAIRIKRFIDMIDSRIEICGNLHEAVNKAVQHFWDEDRKPVLVCIK